MGGGVRIDGGMQDANCMSLPFDEKARADKCLLLSLLLLLSRGENATPKFTRPCCRLGRNIGW